MGTQAGFSENEYAGHSPNDDHELTSAATIFHKNSKE
jgi:hypothetical protein